MAHRLTVRQLESGSYTSCVAGLAYAEQLTSIQPIRGLSNQQVPTENARWGSVCKLSFLVEPVQKKESKSLSCSLSSWEGAAKCLHYRLNICLFDLLEFYSDFLFCSLLVLLFCSPSLLPLIILSIFFFPILPFLSPFLSLSLSLYYYYYYLLILLPLVTFISLSFHTSMYCSLNMK